MMISPVCAHEWDCGLVAVEYLLGLRGIMIPEDCAEIAESTELDGTSHEGICRLLQAQNLQFEQRVESIGSIPIPAIVNYQWDGDGHYGVLVAKTESEVFIFNPAHGGIDRYVLADFDSIFFSLRYGRLWSVKLL